jgi:glycosyltransferase involved in cell wall biosynthesis
MALREVLAARPGNGQAVQPAWDREAQRLVATYEPHRQRRKAVLVVRNTCRHDARVLRSTKVLQEMGYDARVLAVRSGTDRDPALEIDGVYVERLNPRSPLARARDVVRAPRTQSGSGAPGVRAPAGPSLPRRINRWLTTLDWYRQAIRVLRRERPAIVHCNDYNTMWIGVAAKLLWRAGVVYDTHELWPDRNLRPEPRAWLLACEALFVRIADRLVTTSPGYAEVIARRYRIDPPTVVRNISEGLQASRNGSPTAGRAALAVYFGAVTTGRGLETALRVLSETDGIRLRIIGPDAWGYRVVLNEKAHALGVAERVELRPPVPPTETASALADADVGLALIEPACLSYELTLPNKLFEYIAADLPILASNVPVLAEFVRAHGVGLVARPDDPADVAAQLTRITRPDLNSTLRAAARRTSEALSWADESRVLAGLYADAAPIPWTTNNGS